MLDRAHARTITLPEVTLLVVTDVALSASARALEISQRDLRFGEVLFLSSQAPPPDILATWREIPPLRSRSGYSRFMLHDLAAHLRTTHALCVQWDGYVVDPSAWDPVFLDYDYIGAPWPHFEDEMTVGNGGFSLRSRRLIDACATLPISNEAEDLAICRTHRRKLETHFGLRFAPQEVARRFAFERFVRTGSEFGFHGAFNMIGQVPRKELANLLKGLEPGLLSRGEHREMLRAALLRGDVRLARTLWARLRHREARRR